MSDFEQRLRSELEELKRQGLYRELREIESPQSTRIQFAGESLLNFSSNDYLGLANHPAVKAGAREALEQYGAGAGASRLICGSLAIFHKLEATIANFKQAEAALTFSTGYAAALGTIGALAGAGDILVLDRLAHACLVDAARLSGATLRVFRHNDLHDLERILKWSRRTSGKEGSKRVLVVTESVFSMDGDRAPLREIVELKEKYGAWLMLDEAHATGVHGPQGRGLAAEAGLADTIEVQMGTLGKALGAAGGYICGSRVLIELLINRARSVIFSTAPVPAAAGAALAALALVPTNLGDALRSTLRERVSQAAVISQPRGQSEARGDPLSAILPIMIGDERQAISLSAALRRAGFFIPAIRYPTVGRGRARLRLTVTAAHSEADIRVLSDSWRAIRQEITP